MVQFFQAGESQQPDYLTQIAAGLGSGISKGIGSSLSEMLKQKKQRAEAREKIPTAFNALLKSYGADKAYDEKTRISALKNALRLSDEGYDPVSSILTSYDEMVAPKQSQTEKALGQQRSSASNLKEDIKSGVAKGVRPLVQVGEVPFEAAHLAEKGIRKGAGKVRGLLGLDPEKAPGDIFSGIQATNPLENESILQKYDRLTGNRGLPENPIERIAAGYPLGISGVVGGATEEAAKGLGVPEEIAPLFNIGGLTLSEKFKIPGKLINAISGWVNKIPKASEAVQSAAKASGVAPEEVVAETASKLKDRGVDLTKVAEGDPAALNEFQKEAQKTSKIFEESERFHKKEALKRRTETAEKLKESPLSEYYKAKPEPGVRAQATEELRTAPLKERLPKLEAETKAAYRKVLEAESSIRSNKGKGDPNATARLESIRELSKNEHSKLLNELRNTEFEIRNKKPPMTSEEIGKQIEKQHAELREGIKDPTVAKIDKLKKNVDADRAAIEQAEKLIKRGEIPGPEVFDEYIKIHQQYNKAYGDLVAELDNFVKENRNIAHMKGQVENAKHVRDLVKQLQKGGEAKVTNQIDKRKSLRALEKPSGAFYKQMLKDLRKDVDQFQKQFFEMKKATTPAEQATSAQAKSKISQDIPQTAATAAKNPTAENISKLSEKTRMGEEDLGRFIGNSKKTFKDAADKVQSLEAGPQTARQATKEILQHYKKLKGFPKVVTNGILIGTIQALSEEFLNYKPTREVMSGVAGTIGIGAGKGVIRGAGTGAIASGVYYMISSAFEKSEVEKLRSLRNTPKFNEKRKELAKKFGDTYANRITKEATKSSE